MHDETMTDPPRHWMERLRRNHKVWLVKQDAIGEIEFPYEPPEAGSWIGRVGVRHNGIHSWYIDRDGRGLDHSQLMLPMLHNLPNNPDPLPEPLVRQFRRELEDMNDRLDHMQRTLHELCILLRGH